MNMQRKVLAASLCGLFQASTEGTAGTMEQPSPQKIAGEERTETTNMEVRSTSISPVTPQAEDPNSANSRGKLRAHNIIAAEQNEVQAMQSLSQTRIDGFKELALIEAEEDRLSWFAGLQMAFMAVGVGGKMVKKHSNYIGEIRKVWNVVKQCRENPEGTALLEGGKTITLAGLVALLDGPGNYAQKVQALPNLSNAGGTNRGRGAAPVAAAATAAVQAQGQGAADAIHRAANIAATPGGAEKLEQAMAMIESGQAQPNAPTDSNKPGPGATLMRDGKPVLPSSPTPISGTAGQEAADPALVNALRTCPEKHLESLLITFAYRLKRSPDGTWRDIGDTVLDMLHITDDNTEETKTENEEHTAQPPETKTGTEG